MLILLRLLKGLLQQELMLWRTLTIADAWPEINTGICSMLIGLFMLARPSDFFFSTPFSMLERSFGLVTGLISILLGLALLIGFRFGSELIRMLFVSAGVLLWGLVFWLSVLNDFIRPSLVLSLACLLNLIVADLRLSLNKHFRVNIIDIHEMYKSEIHSLRQELIDSRNNKDD